jgi:type 1 glutamine amidotransferase
LNTEHPIIDGISSFTLKDEVYGNLQFTPRLNYQVHAETIVEGMRFPMAVTAVGGRIKGAGKTAYLANGHNEETMENKTFLNLIANTVRWLTR